MIYWFLGISSVLLLAIAIHLYDRHLQKKIEEWEKNQKDQ
jgi:p-aminobenzoyl-glutamate transporter AbgT